MSLSYSPVSATIASWSQVCVLFLCYLSIPYFFFFFCSLERKALTAEHQPDHRFVLAKLRRTTEHYEASFNLTTTTTTISLLLSVCMCSSLFLSLPFSLSLSYSSDAIKFRLLRSSFALFTSAFNSSTSSSTSLNRSKPNPRELNE